MPVIADDIIETLSASGDVELEDAAEARLDLEAVLKEHIRRDRQAGDEARERMQREGLSHSMLGRVRARVNKEWGMPAQDEVLPFLLDQLVEMLFHSNNVAEIYADDVALRTTITPILRRHMEVEDELDREVRARIKNLSEGTATFEIEYQRVMEQMKQKKGL
ncbi:MAG: DUF507 family protein [Myxococcales bacterium]|nr:DUF507 family protein [Myxococcales bacterium]